MIKTFRFTLLAVGFALLLLLPTLDQAVRLSARFSPLPNQPTKSMPAFHFPHVGTFVKQFDPYYKENFGGRNALFSLYSRWKLKVLHTSPLPEKVVMGKEGWFYLGDSYNNVVKQHRGLLPLSADSARLIAQNLLRYQRDLAQQGRKLYVFIAPDSHTIYPEYLPDQLQISSAPSRLDVLKAYITQHTTLPFIDVRDTLRQAKQHHVLYYQTDTHWNDYGTLVGSAVLLNRIRRDVATLPLIAVSNYQITAMNGLGGDLVQMLNLQNELKDRVYYDIKPLPAYTARQTAEVPDTVTGVAASGFPSLRYRSANPSRPRLLFIGDSFSHSMIPFVAGYFSESYFVRTSRFDPRLVQAEQPDIVVIEIVERNLNWLGRF